MIRFNCSHYQPTIHTSDKMAGQIVPCTICQSLLTVPQPKPATLPESDDQTVKHQTTPEPSATQPPSHSGPPSRPDIQLLNQQQFHSNPPLDQADSQINHTVTSDDHSRSTWLMPAVIGSVALLLMGLFLLIMVSNPNNKEERLLANSGQEEGTEVNQTPSPRSEPPEQTGPATQIDESYDPRNRVIKTEPKLGYQYVADELLVIIREGFDVENLRKEVKRKDLMAQVVRKLSGLNMALLQVDPEKLFFLRNEMNKLQSVQCCGLNYVYTKDNNFNDDVLHNSNPRDDWGTQAIKAPKAWKLATGNGVKVGVLDSGAYLNHPDLKLNIIFSHSLSTHNSEMETGEFINNSGKRDFYTAHGTHVAGTIAAVGNNGHRAIGIAPNAELMIFQVLLYNPSDNAVLATSDAQQEGFRRAIDKGCQVINFSIGSQLDSKGNQWVNGSVARRTEIEREIMNGYTDSNGIRRPGVINSAPFYEHIANKASMNNVIIVKAAGNDKLPAYLDPLVHTGKVLVVAAVQKNGSGNSFGRASSSRHGSAVDISAPGVDIYSTYPSRSKLYESLSGTSMAAPHVAGVVAMMKELRPELTLSQVRKILRATGQPVTSDEDMPIPPMVNAGAALEMVKTGVAPSPEENGVYHIVLFNPAKGTYGYGRGKNSEQAESIARSQLDRNTYTGNLQTLHQGSENGHFAIVVAKTVRNTFVGAVSGGRSSRSAALSSAKSKCQSKAGSRSRIVHEFTWVVLE